VSSPRSLVTIVLASAVFGLSCDVAVAAPTFNFSSTPEFGSRSGEGTSDSAFIALEGTEYGGAPYPLHTLTYRLPVGAGLSFAGFPTCPQATLEPSGIGPSGCPEGSMAGETGTFRAFVQFGKEYVEENGTVYAYMLSEGRIALLLWGHSPVAFEDLAIGTPLAPTASFGPGFSFTFPFVETVPGGHLGSVAELQFRLGAFRRSEGLTLPSLTTATECNASSLWQAEAGLDDHSGHTVNLTREFGPSCAPSGTRIPATTSVSAAPGVPLPEGEVAEEVFTATVTPKTAGPPLSGFFSFFQNGYEIPECKWTGIDAEDHATCQVLDYLGEHLNITALYHDDFNYAPSISAPLELVIGAEPPGHKTEESPPAGGSGGTLPGSGTPAPSGGGSSLGGGTPVASISRAEIAAALTEVLARVGKGITAAGVVKHRGVRLAVRSLEAGTLSISWYGSAATHAAAAKTILIGAGWLSFAGAGSGTLKLRLTSAGARLLRGSKHAHLTEKAAFAPAGGATVNATHSLALH